MPKGSKALIDAMNDGILDGMQSFDYELERLITAGVIDRETGLSYATNRTNLALRLDTQGAGGGEVASVPLKDAKTSTSGIRRAPAPKNDLDDLIER